MDESKNIAVFIEYDRQNKVQNVSLELIGKAREIADQIGEKVVAIALGHNIKNTFDQLVQSGADEVVFVDQEELETYGTEKFTFVIEQIIKEYNFLGLLIGATILGRDLGPRISCRLKTGLTADCTSIDIDADERLIRWTRPAFGGNILATILCPDHHPQIGTVRSNVLPRPELDPSRSGTCVEKTYEIPEKLSRAKIIRTEKIDVENVNLENAEFILSIGRGVGSKDRIPEIEQYAEMLDATLGASRAIVDAGWISHSHQVGQTGKTVSPKIYIACGISGQIQHLAGMSSSDYIIAINKDPDAPIFHVADLGIVGDLFEVLPEFIKNLEKNGRTLK